MENSDTQTVKDRRDWSHDAGEDFRGREQTETEGLELVSPPEGQEPKVPPAPWMIRNLEIGILQVDGDHPVVPLNCMENRLGGLHLERSLEHKPVQEGEGDHWTPRIQRLPHYKQATVKPRGGMSKFDCPFGDKRTNLP